MDIRRKQKILLVHDYYQIPGGEDTVVANEKKMLEDNGHEVVFYSRHNDEIKRFSPFKKALLPLISIFNLKTYRDIKQIIKDENIDIVHVHNTIHLISPAVYYAAIKCKVPVVQTVHNFRLLCPAATLYRDGHICEDCLNKGLKCALKHKCYRNSRLETAACVLSTKIHRLSGIYGKINYICLTEFNKEKLLKLKEINPEKVFVKPNFVEPKCEIIPYNERDNQFIFVGRLDKLKGVDFLFEVWKTMGEAAPKLIVCGTGPMEKWCKEFIEKNKLNIEMKGFVPNDEAVKIIAKSKALLFPTQWYEGFPMTIVEAFSVGTPVIGSNLGNVSGLIESNVLGIKYESNSTNSLINSVRKYEDLESLNLETDIFNYFKSKYSNFENYKIFIDIYNAITER